MFFNSLLGEMGGHRANSDRELIRLAQTGGVFGVGFWSAAIGTASVDNIVGTILRAVVVLRTVEKKDPLEGGFHTVRVDSEHIALGSDWDGAVEVAVDASQVVAIILVKGGCQIAATLRVPLLARRQARDVFERVLHIGKFGLRVATQRSAVVGVLRVGPVLRDHRRQEAKLVGAICPVEVGAGQ